VARNKGNLIKGPELIRGLKDQDEEFRFYSKCNRNSDMIFSKESDGAQFQF
jgi:hypothetical protein